MRFRVGGTGRGGGKLSRENTVVVGERSYRELRPF